MTRVTTDPEDPDLRRGSNDEPVPQNDAYLVVDSKDRERVRPYRETYRHNECGTNTTMSSPIAETYAVSPGFYAATYCVHCRKHRPVGEFVWAADGTVLGS